MFYLFGPSGTHVVFQEAPYRIDRMFQKRQLALLKQDSCSKMAKTLVCKAQKTLYARYLCSRALSLKAKRACDDRVSCIQEKTINGIQCAPGSRRILALLEHVGYSIRANWSFWNTWSVLYYKSQNPDFVPPGKHDVCSRRAKLKIVSNIYFDIYQ